MPKLRPENVDCFFYQYNSCTQRNCPHPHREKARQKNVVCQAWKRHKNCRNKQCSYKHLDKEAMKRFFHCLLERNAGVCRNMSCLCYHEKLAVVETRERQFYRFPSQVPIQEKSNWQKKKHVRFESPERGNLVSSSTAFIEVAVKFIRSSLLSGKLPKEKASCYLKEILHSIFFVGYINRPSIYPEEILNEENLSIFKRKFPDVFEVYKTQLPLRPPYSALLDAVVDTTGASGSTADEEEYKVLDKLLDLNKTMNVTQYKSKTEFCGNSFYLAATVVSYCYFEDFVTNEKTKKYFGASIACKGKAQRQIFIDLSCIKSWNQNVALSVCLVAGGNLPLSLPQYLHSAAFKMCRDSKKEKASTKPHKTDEQQSCGQVDEGNATDDFSYQRNSPATDEPMSSQPLDVDSSSQLSMDSSQTDLGVFYYHPKPPCVKCLELFPGVTFLPQPNNFSAPADWDYGNCAECEALSKLLNAEKSINMRVTGFLPSTFNIRLAPQLLQQNAHLPALELLKLPRIDRLAQNLRTAGFQLGTYFHFYDPVLSGESTALVPLNTNG